MKPLFKRSLILLVATFATVSAHAISGKWRGELSLGPTKLPLVLNFTEKPGGLTEATMDSPLQNALGIPLEVKFCSGDSLSLACAMIGATYTAKISDNLIEGIFSQQGYRFPLTLTPEDDITVRRPQTPVPPFPYSVTDTAFTSFDGTRLAGTIVVPAGSENKKFPMVVMITGSGPQNRDEEIFEHRPFAVIADALARNGIASLRYDDRGTAKSQGNYAEATIETFTNDAKSALEFAKSLPYASKTGLLGHSEGGTIAVLIAAEQMPDFIISMAGMVVAAKQTILEQNLRMLDKVGITPAEKDASLKLIDILFDQIIAQHMAGKSEPLDIDLICKENSLTVPSIVLESVKRNNSARNAYFDSLVSLDPTPVLKKIKCPVLALNGAKDTQVNPDSNLQAFSLNLPDAEIHRLEGLNHLFQTCTTGDLSEYNQIKETISPTALNLILTFLNQNPSPISRIRQISLR